MPITEDEPGARAPVLRIDRDSPIPMTDHTTPLPEPPADPTRDPEDDTLSPSSPGHPHHENPQKPEEPPSKDPV
ncbi:hypothetical protein [Burkholderia thailandensis]|nr:hypothetical protein [Burkholderia thailandensis]